MSNTNHTPKYQLSFVSGICIGLEEVLIKGKGMKYSEIVCNTVLPDTDEEYEEQKDTIEGRMKLFAAAPELLLALEGLLDFPMEDLEAWAAGNKPITVTYTPQHIGNALKIIQKIKG